MVLAVDTRRIPNRRQATSQRAKDVGQSMLCCCARVKIHRRVNIDQRVRERNNPTIRFVRRSDSVIDFSGIVRSAGRSFQAQRGAASAIRFARMLECTEGSGCMIAMTRLIWGAVSLSTSTKLQRAKAHAGANGKLPPGRARMQNKAGCRPDAGAGKNDRHITSIG